MIPNGPVVPLLPAPLSLAKDQDSLCFAAASTGESPRVRSREGDSQVTLDRVMVKLPTRYTFR